nr:hypothetical protein [Micromonospora sp. DSM 115978]
MRQFHVLLTRSDNGWTVRAPDAGQATIPDPSLADFQARQLIQHGHNLDLDTVDELDILLVNEMGQPVYVFDLVFTSDLTDDGPGPANTLAYEALEADPPAGCQLDRLGPYPTLRCVRPGSSRLDAISALAAEVRSRYGIEANDLGFEKLWEWAGSREWRERMIAHLLLMAAHRARLTGVPTEELTHFLRTSMAEQPSPKHSGGDRT